MMAFEGVLQGEKIRSATQNPGMTHKQAEILNYSYNHARKAASKLSTNYEDFVSQIDSGIHRQVDHYINTQHQKSETTIEKAFGGNNTEIHSVVIVAKSNGFSRDNAIKLVEDAIACRVVEIADLRNQGISLEFDDTFHHDLKSDKVKKIIDEFKRYGIDTVDKFYRIGNDIQRIDDVNTLAVYESELSELAKLHKLDSKVLKGAAQLISSKRFSLLNPNQSRTESQKSSEQEYQGYHALLKEALEYLDFLYPGKNVSKFIVDSYRALAKGRDKTLDLLPFLKKYYASCPALVKAFWTKQLQRNIENPESIGLTKNIAEKLKRYIFDRKLVTESGAWSQTVHIDKHDPNFKFYAERPGSALVGAIKQYLSIPPENRNGNPDGDRITIIVNDNKVLKLFLKPNSTEANIAKAIKAAENDVVSVDDPKLKYRLKADSYRPENHSKEYLDFYQHQDQFTPFGLKAPKFINNMINKPVNGDYIFRLTTKSEAIYRDKNSAFSMYTVDSNKALIDIDLSGPVGGEISIKYSHHFFDADNQSDIFDRFVDTYLNQAAGFLKLGTDTLRREKFPTFGFVNDARKLRIPTSTMPDTFDEYPIFESINTGMIDRTVYEPIEIRIEEQNHKIPANIVRDILLAYDEGVNDFYTLYKINKHPIDVNPCHDEISPLTIGLSPFKNSFDEYKKWRKSHDDSKEHFNFGSENLRKVVDWIVKTEKAIKRTKDGQSYQAVVAAPTDRLSKVTYETTKKPHGPPSQLMETGGMTSGINVKGVKKKDFVTAVSRTSAPKIKLINKDGKIIAEKNIGVVGLSGKFGDVSISVRKDLINAQYQITELFDGNVKAIKIIEPLINAWENFTSGEVTFEEYQVLLKSTYNQLYQKCGHVFLDSRGITNYKKLQYKLNNQLEISSQKDIHKRIDRSEELQLLHDFFVQVQSAVALTGLRSSPGTSPSRRKS